MREKPPFCFFEGTIYRINPQLLQDEYYALG